MKNDLVSIITPIYNAEKFINETIQSVIEQTYENWELILVDDCSTDSSAMLISNFAKQDTRIKYFKLDQNSGPAVARNIGIDKASGQFIAFLDSDDMWVNTKLEIQISFMKENNIAFSFTSYKTIKENGEKSNKSIKVPLTVTYKQLLSNTIIGCLTVIIDKSLVGEFKMPLVRAGQDTATWLSILKNGVIAHGINHPLAYYRLVDGSISHNKFKAVKRTWNIYRNIENLSLFKSLQNLFLYMVNAFYKRVFYY